MNFLKEFFQQKVPKSGREMPAYYRRALVTSQKLLAVYFPIMMMLLTWANGRFEWVPAVMFAAILACLFGVDRMSMRANFILYTVVILAWCGWYIHACGWNSGAQHFLLPVLMLIFFNVYEPPLNKAIYFFALVAYRMTLFYYSMNHSPVHALDQASSIALQTVNSVMLYLIMACICVLFSTSVQDTERQLRIDNQELHKEAGTDPLTALPNRRAMLDLMKLFLDDSPNEYFCVAIADIDFFKRVNDTYGHHCGDYTLRTLADLFKENAGSAYSVCRWGGEEFCFFMPGMNLDQAGRIMNDLCSAVRHMPLSFEGNDFSIAITIGVAENDFHSTMDEILEEADQKLYIGKNSGRNQVVV